MVSNKKLLGIKYDIINQINGCETLDQLLETLEVERNTLLDTEFKETSN